MERSLHEWMNELSRQWFSKPFTDKVIMNHRLRTTGGRYIPSKRTIELNPKYLEELGLEEFEGIMKHELCHYHLHIEGKGYQHRDPEFRALMKATGSPRHCKPLPSAQRQKKYVYQCMSCEQQYARQRQIDLKRYRCGSCKGSLKKVTKRIDD
ncbi:hypothetical protein N781_07270 [Pontibacillus halophilus JSM 076056 = DSM 19796]|uniref:SprT-like domain-containing protein n=1 Tax=Pontibacillus halophilus JSM 076056 = DSM 19796 TaxID=1385510 RepID=A0A0A5GH95_9BACI|nr:SprT family protein [Pontibacillus halophilus]KGX90583.1 hypothetical protein N781_07270 [Pontibacillus halophilus JSM 076056 = DSM 19796]